MSCDFKGLINHLLKPEMPESLLETLLFPEDVAARAVHDWANDCNPQEVELKETGGFAHEEVLREVPDGFLKPRLGSSLWSLSIPSPVESKEPLECNAETPAREMSCSLENLHEEGWREVVFKNQDVPKE